MNTPHTFRTYLESQDLHSRTVSDYVDYLSRFLNWCEDAWNPKPPPRHR